MAIMIDPTRPLELTGLEVVFLTDAISNRDVAEGLPDKDAYYPLARQTLLLLGSTYCELVSADGILNGPVTLYVTQEMAWLLRGKVKTGDVGVDGVVLGHGLLCKLYELLLAFNADVDMPVSKDEGEAMTDFKRWTLKIAEESNATRRSTDQDAGRGSDADA